MDPAPPSTLRGRLLQGVAGLIALLVLYVLSSGPAAYVWMQSMKVRPVFDKIYAPITYAHGTTPLLDPLAKYTQWWADLAVKQGVNVEAKTPPEQP